MLASVFFLGSFINELLTPEWLREARESQNFVSSSQNFVSAVNPKPHNSVRK